MRIVILLELQKNLSEIRKTINKEKMNKEIENAKKAKFSIFFSFHNYCKKYILLILLN